MPREIRPREASPRVARLPRAVAGLVLGLAAATLVATPAHADHEPLPDGRRAVPYVVEAGDTASGLASRFHAWTAELIAYNHLGGNGSLRVGQRIVIPVVATGARGVGRTTMWQHPDRDREKVRRVIAGAARNHGVDPQLALAIAWQESGWQMGVVSHARAIGAMQVLPATGRWMEHYAGRPLDLRTLGDNATAGVLLLRVLAADTHRRTHKIGAYYQGLGAVRRHGLYDETRDYVGNVEAIKRRLEDGRPPA
jgi:soluble lytic murein transglycosylase-like protein